MEIDMSSPYEIDVNEYEDDLTLKIWWSLWIIEKCMFYKSNAYDSSKLIDEGIYMFYEAWTYDMNDI